MFIFNYFVLVNSHSNEEDPKCWANEPLLQRWFIRPVIQQICSKPLKNYRFSKIFPLSLISEFSMKRSRNSDFKLDLGPFFLFLCVGGKARNKVTPDLKRQPTLTRCTRPSSVSWRPALSTAICALSLHYHDNRAHELKDTNLCLRRSTDDFSLSRCGSFHSVRWRRRWFYLLKRRVLLRACASSLWRTWARRGRKKLRCIARRPQGQTN